MPRNPANTGSSKLLVESLCSVRLLERESKGWQLTPTTKLVLGKLVHSLRILLGFQLRLLYDSKSLMVKL
ncbi:hypothetical protein ACS0TY_008912 [Phlomoides rotata]